MNAPFPSCKLKPLRKSRPFVQLELLKLWIVRPFVAMNYFHEQDEAHDERSPNDHHSTPDALPRPQQQQQPSFFGGGWSEESKLAGLFSPDDSGGGSASASQFGGLADESARGHDTLLPPFSAFHANMAVPALHTHSWANPSAVNASGSCPPWGALPSSFALAQSNSSIPQQPQSDHVEENYQQFMLQPGMEQAMLLCQLHGLQQGGNPIGANMAQMTAFGTTPSNHTGLQPDGNTHPQVAGFASNPEQRIATLPQGAAFSAQTSHDLANFANLSPGFRPMLEPSSSHLFLPPDPIASIPPIFGMSPAMGPGSALENVQSLSGFPNNLGSDPHPAMAKTEPLYSKERSKHVQAHETRNRQLQLTPSERSFIVQREWKTPDEVLHVLNVLGSTLRSKADPYFDSTSLPVTHVPRSPRGGVSELFPDKLYRMLSDLESEGLDDVAAFLPHGRAFMVYKLDVFQTDILPRFFRGQTKWSSFSRQLNLYGFLRVSCGRDAVRSEID